MVETIFRILDQDKLKTCIDALRDVLNKMCYTIDEPEYNIEKLIISRQLDELIVKYMSIKK